MRDQDGTASRAALEAANRRIQAAIEALPDYASPEFWPALAAQGTALPAEVLVHVVRVLRVHGAAADVERAADELIARAYPIAAAIVRRTLLSRPQDREDAICDALAAMWRHIVAGTPFWERNFVGALNAVCISVCRSYLARKRTATVFTDLSTAEEGTAYDERLPDRAADAEQEQLLGRLTYERALASLEPGLREIARLMAEGELTQRQIAARVGCTEKTVYNRLARIRDHLASYFYGEVHDDH
jgi:RNA polymerase sigma factor (sigma-70 family)